MPTVTDLLPNFEVECTVTVTLSRYMIEDVTTSKFGGSSSVSGFSYPSRLDPPIVLGV